MGDALFGGGAAANDAPGGAAGGDLTGTYPNPTVKASVALTGTPTAPTAAAATNTTQLATTAFVTGAGFAAYATAGTWTAKQTHSAISTIAVETQQTATNTVVRNLLLSGDANPAFSVLGSGKLQWGPGGASATDVELYRVSSARIQTDGGLTVGGQAVIGGSGNGATVRGGFKEMNSDGSTLFDCGFSNNNRIGFYGTTATVQQTLATGAAHTVDDVITALQTLGLVKQS